MFQQVFQIRQPLERVLDIDLDHAHLAALGDQTVHLGRRQVEQFGDFRLFLAFQEMQHENRVHLAHQLDIVFLVRHLVASSLEPGQARFLTR